MSACQARNRAYIDEASRRRWSYETKIRFVGRQALRRRPKVQAQDYGQSADCDGLCANAEGRGEQAGTSSRIGHSQTHGQVWDNASDGRTCDWRVFTKSSIRSGALGVRNERYE